MAFQSTHNLDFLSRPCQSAAIVDTLYGGQKQGWQEFKIGTCFGQWRATDEEFEILSVINDQPGNGHLQDVFDWFYRSCRREGRGLRIREFFNPDFKRHLIEQRGFSEAGSDVIKSHDEINPEVKT